MKNPREYMIRLAERLMIKYAAFDAQSIKDEVSRTLQSTITNASSYTANGIMPLMKMLTDDQANLAINITRNGDEITVSPPTVTPGSAAPRYTALPQQIETYLNKNLGVFPTTRNGEAVTYNNLTVTLQFVPQPQQEIAQKS